MSDEKFVLAIDQGTTSSRAIVFDHSGQIVATGQKEHEQIFPRAGWVEHDPKEIWTNVREVVGLALTRANLTYRDIAAVGITNQRETAVVWDKTTGEPVYNAIVWQDTRTDKIVAGLAARRRARQVQEAGRAAAGDLLLRPEDQVDPRQRRRRPREGRGRRPAVRQHRHVGAVEHDRRRRRRRARHRRHQRLAHHAHGPRHACRGTPTSPPTWASRCRCCPRSAPPRRSTATAARAGWCPACRSPASSATSRPPRSARRASRSAWPRTPTAPATSCSSTRAPPRCPRRTAC